MKRNVIILFCLIALMPVLSQTITQQGVAYRYNGKQQRTPLGNVTIQYDANRRTTLSGEDNGTFTLLLDGRKMGDRIGLVTIKKREMMVFNQHAVDEWSIRKEPLMLILCNADEFERQKENLINIGKREAKKKYDRQKAELEAKLSASQIKLQEYEAALDKAYDELDHFQKNLGEYADIFARIDESEVDTLAQQAMDLFNQGKIEEAVHRFEEGHYMDKLQNVNRTIKQGKTIIDNVQQEIRQAQTARDGYIKSLKAQIEAYKLQGDWDKQKKLLKGLADELNGYEEIAAYAAFCYDNRLWKEALVYQLKMLEIVEKQDKDNNNRMRKGNIYLSLTCIYDELREEEEYKQMCFNTCEYFRELSEYDFHAYGKGYAAALRNMGAYYDRHGMYDEAIVASQESLNLFLQIESKSPNSCVIDIAALQNNIGLMLSKKGNKVEAERMVAEAEKSYRKLSEEDYDKYACYLSYPLTDLGSIYCDLGKFKESETALLEALNIRYEWALKNPFHAEPLFSKSLYIIRQLYYTPNSGIKDTCFDKVLNLYKQLEAKYPQRFGESLANELYYAAGEYWKLEEYEKCKESLIECIKTNKRISENIDNNRLIGAAYLNLGVVYNKLELYDLCKQSFEEASNVFYELSKNDSTFLSQYAAAVGSLSAMNIRNKEFDKAEKNARAGISADSTQLFIIVNLAEALLYQGKVSDAEILYRKYKDRLKTDFLDGLKEAAEAGIIPKEYEADVEKIKKMLEE